MDWGTITSAICALITAWFAYNQYTKHKMTDLKIEKWKKEEELKSKKRNGNVSKIYGVLWYLLHDLQADRVYIIQPHPLDNNAFISISFEVRRNGVVEMKNIISKMPMSDLAYFCSELAQKDILMYKDVSQDIKDKRAKALFSTNGSRSTVIKRLNDDKFDWLGSLVCDFTTPHTNNPDYLRKQLIEAASNIQYILPEFNG